MVRRRRVPKCWIFGLLIRSGNEFSIDCAWHPSAKWHIWKKELDIIRVGPVNDELCTFKNFVLGTALLYASPIFDNLPPKSIPTTPYKLWTRCKPNLEHLNIWGCSAYVLKNDPIKLESRTDVCLFIGYPRGSKAYEFYSLRDKKVIVSTRATFLEDDCVKNHKPISEIDLDELNLVTSTTSTNYSINFNFYSKYCSVA